MRDNKGFAHIFILLVVIGLVIFIGIFLLANFKNRLGSSVPSCPKEYGGLLTAEIMNDDAYNVISPLGNLNPGGGHIIPTDHMYMANITNNKSAKAEVFAAGDMWLTELNESKAYDEQGNLLASEIGFSFHPCKEITLEYGVNELAPELGNDLQAVIRSSKKSCYSGEKPHGLSEQCKYSINYQVKAGQLLGWTDRNEATLDVGAYDTRVSLPFINPKRYSERTLHTICPFDLYSGELKDSFYQKLGGRSENENAIARRTIEPRCGTVMQDVAGTAQGEWFVGKDPNESSEFDGTVISFVHDNVDPSKAVIVIAGTIIPQAGQFTFIPKYQGVINREPTEVKDSSIYCFQNEFPEYGTGVRLTGRILIQLTGPKTLKAEHQEKSCNESLNFNLPTIYER